MLILCAIQRTAKDQTMTFDEAKAIETKNSKALFDEFETFLDPENNDFYLASKKADLEKFIRSQTVVLEYDDELCALCVVEEDSRFQDNHFMWFSMQKTSLECCCNDEYGSEVFADLAN